MRFDNSLQGYGQQSAQTPVQGQKQNLKIILAGQMSMIYIAV